MKAVTGIAIIAIIVAGIFGVLYANSVGTTKTVTTSETSTIQGGTTTATSFVPVVALETVTSTDTSFVPVIVTQTQTTTTYQVSPETVTTTQNETTTVTHTVAMAPPPPANSTCPPFSGTGTPLYCVPMEILNSQSTVTPVGLQILVYIDWSSYGSYLASDVSNVLFADSSGRPLFAWCESGCNSNQSSSNVWVKEDSSIQPFSLQSMFMYIFPVSSNQYSKTGYWGVYPMSTSVYGQYDNGPEVFEFYNNFNGTSLCSCLTALAFLGAGTPGGSTSYNVSNGLTITATGIPGGWGYGYHVYLNTPQLYSALDTDILSTNSTTNVGSESIRLYAYLNRVLPNASYPDNGFYSGYGAENWVCGCGDSIIIPTDSSGNGSTIVSGPFQGWTGILSIVWPSTGMEYANFNDQQQVSGTDRTINFGQSYPDIAFINGELPTYYVTFSWMRTRISPPNNEMPASSFGSLIAYS